MKHLATMTSEETHEANFDMAFFLTAWERSRYYDTCVVGKDFLNPHNSPKQAIELMRALLMLRIMLM
jgi:hypothetical protein